MSLSLVITSCGRLNLLDLTIKSFLKFNTYPIDQYLLIDDSGSPEIHAKIKENYPQFDCIFNEKRIGQIKSIDKIYREVRNPYIFHCEDDWEFYRSGFIEESKILLDFDENIINVWLREQTDTNGHPIERNIMQYDRVKFKKVCKDWNGWHGFDLRRDGGPRNLNRWRCGKPPKK